MKLMSKGLWMALAFLTGINGIVRASAAQIELRPTETNSNATLVAVLEKAASYKGRPVTVKLYPGVYRFSRTESVREVYYVSNTASEKENPNPQKHIALLMRKLKNVTIDGCGSTLLMGGEMTSFIIDSCENIVLKNICIDYEKPTQTELQVLEKGENYLISRVHPTSQYKIENGKLEWYGEGWSFSHGIAQSYDRAKDITWRSWSPMSGLKKTVELSPNLLYMEYDRVPEVAPLTVFQMRDAIRDEVCGLIYRSKNVTLENVHFYYLGNFGVVCQCSENITFHHDDFMPKPGSGRTNAGFADFIQVSGCRGAVQISDSKFIGAHDDAINIHGTYLKAVDFPDRKTIKVRFMHSQTYGFEAFFAGDEIELTDAESLCGKFRARVTKVRTITPREMELTLDKSLPDTVRETGNLVVENVTWTPSAKITGNYFARIPTRGILLKTRRRSLIENNMFYGMQMSAISISNDALSWYESGPVHHLTIRHNTFLECGSPVIFIDSEYINYEKAVHRDILIEENVMESSLEEVKIVQAKGVNGLTVRNNLFKIPKAKKDLIETADCDKVFVENNAISSSVIGKTL